MANEIDELMSADPLKLSDQDLDAIIAYHRQYRANLAGGAKRAKKDEGPKLKLDLSKLIGLTPAAPKEPMKRRV